MQIKKVTRFAPSPTGLLHQGHAFSALLAYNWANKNDARFILRIEDIDQTRCKPQFTETIFKDLHWLGLTWDEPVRIQSEHFSDYDKSITKLKKLGLLYPCFCTRADIKKEIANSPTAPHGFDGVIYPQICKKLTQEESESKINAGLAFALRLDMDKAVSLLKSKKKWPLFWQEKNQGKVQAKPQEMGDIVLARKETPTSYHLSVVVDDHLQNVSHIIRGVDLYEATHIHRLLQELLGFNAPTYQHHELIKDEAGRRLSKRIGSPDLKTLREQGESGALFSNKLLLKS